MGVLTRSESPSMMRRNPHALTRSESPIVTRPELPDPFQAKTVSSGHHSFHGHLSSKFKVQLCIDLGNIYIYIFLYIYICAYNQIERTKKYFKSETHLTHE